MSHPARVRVERLRESSTATTLELFFDLVFVFALTQITALMADEPTGHGLLRGHAADRRGLVVLGRVLVDLQRGQGRRGPRPRHHARRDVVDVPAGARDPRGVRGPARRAAGPDRLRVRLSRAPGRAPRAVLDHQPRRPRAAPPGRPVRADDGRRHRAAPARRGHLRHRAAAALARRGGRRLRRHARHRRPRLAAELGAALRGAARPDRDRRARRVDRRDRRRRHPPADLVADRRRRDARAHGVRRACGGPTSTPRRSWARTRWSPPRASTGCRWRAPRSPTCTCR